MQLTKRQKQLLAAYELAFKNEINSEEIVSEIESLMAKLYLETELQEIANYEKAMLASFGLSP